MKTRVKNITILIVDDDRNVRTSLKGVLEDEGFNVLTAESGEECLKMLKDHPVDIILLDILMPGGIDGIETLRRIKELNTDIIVIIISGHGTIELAVRAMELGAIDFIEKPLSIDRILIRIEQAIDKKRLQDENIRLKKELDERYQMIGESKVMRDLYAQIMKLAPTNSRVLIIGENGTGKELVARAIHMNSRRRDKPFVQVNCAAIPDELIESELFGHEKGAFTGAIYRTQGKFEQADGGTLMLDEIGDMSLRTQAKVLRAIETQEFTRVGGKETIKVDVRIIAATNKDLEEEVNKGTFRKDLFYRLNVIPIYVPPLRDRIEDIPLLVSYFLNKFCSEHGKREKKITPAAMKALQMREWKGNVRELKNMIERLVILTPSDVIDVQDLPPEINDRDGLLTAPNLSLKEAKNEFERRYILQVLRANNWDISESAEQLGIERTNLYRKMKQYNISRESNGHLK